MERLQELLSPWEEPKHSGRSICPTDLLLLTRLAESLGSPKIVEFGCGLTTQELLWKGFDLTTFSIDVSQPLKDTNQTAKYIQCNLSDPFNVAMVLAELENADLLVIDADHSFKFAKFYSENYIDAFDGPIWIHDYFNRPPTTGEQRYLDKFIIGKTHRRVLTTDLPRKVLSSISKEIGYDLTHWMRSVTKGKRACLGSVVIERK